MDKTFFKMLFAIKCITALFLLIYISSCASNNTVVDTSNSASEITISPQIQTDTVRLLFGGDIMAHKPNFNMKNYSIIWDAIRDNVCSADYAFANIEAPVVEALPYSSFPNFNMHPEYPQEAINAGFNVFSIINNHTNDQTLDGMKATMEWAKQISEKTKDSPRPIHFSGLNEISGSPITYELIDNGKWKIIFCAVTEILNRPTYKSYMNFIQASDKGWTAFLEKIKEISESIEHDLFILSIHTDEPEYVFEISEKRRNYYYNLIDNGIDVVWTNHPHIPREREFIGNKATQKLEKVIIYGNGNTISGQRWEPDFKNPSNPRDHTGDGYLLDVSYSKDSENPKPVITNHRTFYITTYINSSWEFIIKNLDDEFINYLEENGRHIWSDYIRQRKIITEKTKETITWR